MSCVLLITTRLSLVYKRQGCKRVQSVCYFSRADFVKVELIVNADYVGNEQETQRNPSVNDDSETIEAVSSNIDDRTMHEVYVWPFQNAVKAGVASFMCSYNRINGSYGCQNSKTQNGILKDELGFQGYVSCDAANSIFFDAKLTYAQIMSDWGATHSGVPAIEAGEDMDMPGTIGFVPGGGSFFGGNITRAINNGSLSIDRLDDMCRRVMTPYFHLQQSDYPTVDGSTPALGGSSGKSLASTICVTLS